jgi:hypothetical protein
MPRAAGIAIRPTARGRSARRADADPVARSSASLQLASVSAFHPGRRLHTVRAP